MKRIVIWFKSLFNSLKSQWRSLDPIVQSSFKIASEIVDSLLFISNIKEAELLVSLLSPRIGPIAFASLKKYLPQIGIILGIGKTITQENSVEENILLISKYLKDKQGLAWASNADQLYKLLTVALADEKITFGEAQLIGKWVYDNIIKIQQKQ